MGWGLWNAAPAAVVVGAEREITRLRLRLRRSLSCIEIGDVGFLMCCAALQTHVFSASKPKEGKGVGRARDTPNPGCSHWLVIKNFSMHPVL
jgi:hypothetical protein